MFEWYAQQIDYYQATRKGICVYNANGNIAQEFATLLARKGVPPPTLRTSTLNALALEKLDLTGIDHLILIQDHPDLLTSPVVSVLHRALLPICYGNTARPVTVSLISYPDRTVYSNFPVPLASVHDFPSTLPQLRNRLLVEQIVVLLDNVNFVFSYPTEIDQNPEGRLDTPIEVRMREILSHLGLGFDSQVRLGRYWVDFIAENNGQKLVIECDGRGYHDRGRDAQRDREIIDREQIQILRFTGSQIWSQAEYCKERIQEAFRFPTKIKRYQTDPDLDDDQRKAIEPLCGPIRVLAPAGSGKTKTLINRIVSLIDRSVPPESILALAFNKKAAQEIQKRLKDRGIPIAIRLGRLGVSARTFHSLGNEVVTKEYGWTSREEREVSIIARDLARQAFSELSGLERGKYQMADAAEIVLEHISKVKNELSPLDEYTIELEGARIPFKPIFARFVELQVQRGLITFDDMIYFAAKALLENPVRRRELQLRFEHVLIDEFQDLNLAQLLLAELLISPQNNPFIVGDDDQMIYGWRGADVRYLLRFDGRYPLAQTVVLSTNYRSSTAIVRHSKHLIEHNTNRHPKKIKPKEDADPGRVDLLIGTDLIDQAKKAADWIRQQKAQGGCKWADFALLTRFHEYQYPLALAFDSLNIPHTPVNSGALFKSSPGKAIRAYLTIILHPEHAEPEHFREVLNVPNRYVARDVIATLNSWDAFQAIVEVEDLEDWKREKLRDFIRQLAEFRAQIPAVLTKPEQVVNSIVTEFDIRKHFQGHAQDNRDLDRASEEITLDVIAATAQNFDSIETFWEHMILSAQDQTAGRDERQERDQVLLSTIHAVKGQEFRNVVLFNLRKDQKDSSRDVEEERRVYYVGLTRAIDAAAITAPQGDYLRSVPETVLNPEWTSQTPDQLDHRAATLAQELHQLERALNNAPAEIKALCERFPELNGAELQLEYDPRIMPMIRQINSLLSEYPELDGASTRVSTSIPIFRELSRMLRRSEVERARRTKDQLWSGIEKLELRAKEKRTSEVRNAKDQLERLRSITPERVMQLKDELERLKLELHYRQEL